MQCQIVTVITLNERATRELWLDKVATMKSYFEEHEAYNGNGGSGLDIYNCAAEFY